METGTGGYAEPNVRATEVELYDGLVARSQNCWPSLDFDVLGINSLISRFIPAGFYYKTFMWPRSFWLKYEHFIRQSAGMGECPKEPDAEHYENTTATAMYSSPVPAPPGWQPPSPPDAAVPGSSWWTNILTLAAS